MAARARTRPSRSSHPPLWLVEGLDILHRKATSFGITVVVVVLAAALLALIAPGLVPATPAIGATIGVAALLLGVAVAMATDASDLTVRGPRHVAAAGGELVAVLPRDPSVAAAGPLATAIVEVRDPGAPLLLAFATASRDARRANAWTEAIARALVADGCGVLRVDLASGRSDQPGLVEVVRDGQRLAEVVTFQPGLKLAEMTAGRDHTDALAALAELPARLPRDLDILLVSLPTAANRAVVAAATALDHVLVVAERDRTSRVDLIASLDALGAAGTQAQVVLLDTQTAMRLAPPVVAETDTEAAERRAIASTVGTAPVVEPGSDGEPVPVPEDELDEPLDEELADDGAEDASLDDAAEDELAVSIDAVLADEPPAEVEDEPGLEEPEDRTGAGAATDEPGPDDDRDLRDTAVLSAAAAATALAIADAEQDLTGELAIADAAQAPAGDQPAADPTDDQDAPAPVEPAEQDLDASEDVDAPRDDGPTPAAMEEPAEAEEAAEELPVAFEEPRVEPVVQLELDDEVRPEGASEQQADEVAAEPDREDATDRLPRVAGPADAPSPDPFAAADEDLLHTTARLAILTQDVVERDEAGFDHLDAGAGRDDESATEPAPEDDRGRDAPA